MIKRQQNKGWSFCCMVLGIFMTFGGLINIISNGDIFDIFWTLIVLGFTVVNGYNIFSKIGIGAFRIDLEIDDSDQEKKKKL